MVQTSERIPVTILTGFLGSGKTTALNALLKHPEMRDTGIIVNEFGKIGLDHLFLTTAIDNIILLDDGCLCCSVKETFKDTLTDLFKRRERSDVPPFTRVLVETTGMADPTPILHLLYSDDFLKTVYRPAQVVTTVDAVLGMVELERYQESRMQVSLADRLVITKTDLTQDVIPPELIARLHGLNPDAVIHSGGAASLNPLEIFSTPAEISAVSQHAEHDHDHARGEAHHHDIHTHGIRADSFVLSDTITSDGLKTWMELVSASFGERMLRCKAVLKIDSIDSPIAIQGVQGIFAEPEQMASWPDGDRSSRLVCISQAIDVEDIRNSLSILHSHATPSALPQPV